ncbi:MAG: glycosyltransferase, partial [Chthoniobacterales bacterium]
IEHALSESDAITTVSESLRGETLTTFRLNHAVEVIPNFFIPSEPKRSRAELRREVGIGEDEFLIVHTSNVRPLKRIDLLLRVFGAAKNRRAMRLLVLAGGPFAPYEQLLDELALRDSVVVRENVLEVEDYLSAADAGLYTSETESFGLSILETLFHARPVVAFRVGGIPEVIRDRETGFLHDFGDIEAMATSLCRLAESPELARSMGERGRRDAEARFSADKIVPRYEALYRQLVSAS